MIPPAIYYNQLIPTPWRIYETDGKFLFAVKPSPKSDAVEHFVIFLYATKHDIESIELGEHYKYTISIPPNYTRKIIEDAIKEAVKELIGVIK